MTVDAHRSAAMAPVPEVSVVVPTRGRPDLLARCLRALLAQAPGTPAHEILVVDDGPHEATRHVVEAMAREATARGGPDLRYLPNPGPHGPAAARNRGWRAARANRIAFTDDDTIPAPDWLARGLQALGPAAGPGPAAVWGRVRMPIPERPTDYELDASQLEHAGFVTANCFVRRSALESVSGFDERFRVAWREDSDLCFSLLAHGLRVVAAPEAVVLHPVRPARWGVSIAQQRKSLFDALLYKKHPERFRERIGASPPWHYYASVAALLAAPVAAAAGSPATGLAALAAWTALTLRFALRRLARTSRAPGHVAEMLVTSAAIPPVAVFWRLAGALRYRVAWL